MKLGYVIIYVESVPDTLSFYQAAFDIEIKFCVPSNEYGELNLDNGTVLAFAQEKFAEQGWASFGFHKNRASDSLCAGAQISFMIDEANGESVETCLEKARNAGATVIQEPETKPWGQTVAYVKDCNGFIVEICTPVKGD